jgi:hypothetical protein
MMDNISIDISVDVRKSKLRGEGSRPIKMCDMEADFHEHICSAYA